MGLGSVVEFLPFGVPGKLGEHILSHRVWMSVGENFHRNFQRLRGSCSSGVEHFLGKEEVMGSNPIKSSISWEETTR